MMYKYIGQNIAEKLGEVVGLSQDDKEVVAYGLEYILSTTIGVTMTLIVGLILGLFTETLAVLFCWGMMRLFAGGAHCTALWRCTVVSFTGILLVVMASKEVFSLLPIESWVIVSTAWTLLAVWLWAPNNSERPVSDPLRRRKMRRTAVAIVLTTGMVLFHLSTGSGQHLQTFASAGATGLATGGLMLSTPGFRIINWYDKKLEFMHHTFIKRR